MDVHLMRLPAVIRKEGDHFVAWSPDLDVASQGPDREQALANLQEAAALYLEDEDVELPSDAPFITTFEVVGDADPDRVR